MTQPTAHAATPATTEALMDSVDRQLLDIIQTGFPLTPRPYADLGQMLGIAEEEALERVRGLKARKIIRRLGANFQSAKLGFVSTLCAAKVPQDKMETFVADVNAKPGVTHNYLREHRYNLWFVLTAPHRAQIDQVLAQIAAETGLAPLDLPMQRAYRIDLGFPLGDTP